MASIDTPAQVARMRERIVRSATREVLVTKLSGSSQEADLQSPVNCGGLGRIRHFRRTTAAGWPENFLPIVPAAKALGLEPPTEMEAQVFQNAACAWRCWYCYVPFELLGGDERKAEWITADRLVQRYADLKDRPPILDLSGGSPDLVPEWPVWTAEALLRRGLENDVYLWSDDNLSTDLTLKLLTEADWSILRSVRYGKVCCIKGFDAESFAYNTGADEIEFERQFERLAGYIGKGLDLYAYVTLTGPRPDRVSREIPRLIERLERVSKGMTRRTVPLRIEMFGPTIARRTKVDREVAKSTQEKAIEVWNSIVVPSFSEIES